MSTDVSKLFTSLGLSSLETKVYLAALQLGPTSVQEIAKKAKISRTAAYQAIEDMQKQGMFSSFERGKKRFFVAEDPEAAVAVFKQKMVRMSEELNSLERILPEIKMMAGGERPAVRFYEGEEAIRALFIDKAKCEPPFLLEVANYNDIYTFLDEKLHDEAKKMSDAKRTKIRILHLGTPKTPNPDIQFCPLLPELGEFHGDIWIYGNRVAFVTFVGKPVTVIIESKPFFDTAKVLFEAAWRVCNAHK